MNVIILVLFRMSPVGLNVIILVLYIQVVSGGLYPFHLAARIETTGSSNNLSDI